MKTYLFNTGNSELHPRQLLNLLIKKAVYLEWYWSKMIHSINQSLNSILFQGVEHTAQNPSLKHWIRRNKTHPGSSSSAMNLCEVN